MVLACPGAAWPPGLAQSRRDTGSAGPTDQGRMPTRCGTGRAGSCQVLGLLDGVDGAVMRRLVVNHQRFVKQVGKQLHDGPQGGCVEVFHQIVGRAVGHVDVVAARFPQVVVVGHHQGAAVVKPHVALGAVQGGVVRRALVRGQRVFVPACAVHAAVGDG